MKIDDENSLVDFEAVRSGQKLSLSKVNSLEQKLRKTPNDLAVRLKLLGYYWQQEINNSVLSLSRYNTICWVITNHPAYHELVQDYTELDNFPMWMWRHAKGLWESSLSLHRDDPLVVFNAATFLINRDYTQGKSLLQLAMNLDTVNGIYSYILCTKAYVQFNNTQDLTRQKELAETVLTEGVKAAELGFPFRQAAWICYSKMSQVAFWLERYDEAERYAGYAPIAEPYEQPEPMDFRSAMFGLISLRRGDITGAKNHLLTKGEGTLGIWSTKLLEELFRDGESSFVKDFLGSYLGIDVSAPDSLHWLEAVKCGLVP